MMTELSWTELPDQFELDLTEYLKDGILSTELLTIKTQASSVGIKLKGIQKLWSLTNGDAEYSATDAEFHLPVRMQYIAGVWSLRYEDVAAINEEALLKNGSTRLKQRRMKWARRLQRWWFRLSPVRVVRLSITALALALWLPMVLAGAPIHGLAIASAFLGFMVTVAGIVSWTAQDEDEPFKWRPKRQHMELMAWGLFFFGVGVSIAALTG